MKIHKKIAAYLLFSLVLPCLVQANTSLQSIAEEGKEYSTLVSPVASQPKVVEFFSFYCGPCYQFVENYPVAGAINKILPEGETVTKYHVSVMGPLGSELTEAWAIAMMMGKSQELEKPLFQAIQNQTLHSIADIQEVFTQSGIDSQNYAQARQSLMVKALIARQNSAMETFEVVGTPSFYINGKYKINNAGIAAATPNDYVNNFANVVQTLLKK